MIELRAAIDPAEIERCAAAGRERLTSGGHLIASATAARRPTRRTCHRRPAARLAGGRADQRPATLTAIGNDVGFENAFARQLIPLGRARDVAIAISTSGSSANIVAGLEEAHRRRMLTMAITGYDGGRLAELDWLDHLFVVHSDYIPRIQEAQATIYLLLEAIGDRP